jgi:tRNA(fMet)-specific endonuclease VapC
MYLLDTDHLGILQHETRPEFGRLTARIAEFEPSDFFVSIVSFHEQVAGWNTYLHRAKDPAGVVKAYAMFETILTRNRRDFERIPGVNVEDWTAV